MSARGRFILRYTGPGPAPAAHLACLRDVPGTKVLDASTNMLRVEGSQQHLEKAIRGLDCWVLSPEKMLAVPDPRKKVEGGPE